MSYGMMIACNPSTGFFPDYANFDGTPNHGTGGGHDLFQSDAWRVINNISVDYYWWQPDPWEIDEADKLQNFFYGQGVAVYSGKYNLDGTTFSTNRSPGLAAMNAVGSLIATNLHAADFVNDLWNIQPPSGPSRYYSGCLYVIGLLQVSGKFRIWGLNK